MNKIFGACGRTVSAAVRSQQAFTQQQKNPQNLSTETMTIRSYSDDNSLGTRPDGFTSAKPTFYNCRKYGHCFPDDCNSVPPFECFYGIPSGMFRNTQGECKIGPGAGASKCGHYQQVEYFCFHHSSFFDMNVWMECCRQKRIDTHRKPNTDCSW